MTQIDAGWGAGPSARYETLAAPFRPIFADIRAGAETRDRERILPETEIGWLKAAGFSTLRVPETEGGLGVTLPELFALLIELSAADPNVTNSLRAHFGFTEDVLYSRDAAYRARWFPRLADRQTVGSGFSETGDSKLGQFSTVVTPDADGGTWRVTGRKFYTTGSLFADWINLGAVDPAGEPVIAVVPRRAEGVEVLDDWDGFGQSLTASGTAVFTEVAVPTDLVFPGQARFRYSVAFFQLVHLATIAGIGRAAALDVARLLGARARIYSHGNAQRAGDDPQLLQVVGRVRSAAYAAGAIVLKAAEAIQRAADSRDGTPDAHDRAIALAELEVSQSVTPVTDLVLDATTRLFDALGASATKREFGLDRHWRNARTIASHNPRVYHDRGVGNFAVNGTLPAGQYRVGRPA